MIDWLIGNSINCNQWILIVINKFWLSSPIVDCHQQLLMNSNDYWNYCLLLTTINDYWQLLTTIENHWLMTIMVDLCLYLIMDRDKRTTVVVKSPSRLKIKKSIVNKNNIKWIVPSGRLQRDQNLRGGQKVPPSPRTR